MSQGKRVLEVLADGKAHSVPEIHRRAGTMRLNSRVAELRNHGHDIVCERVPHAKGAAAYKYTWLNPPPAAPQEPAQLRLDGDMIAPRTEQERYRLYRVRNGGQPELVATVATVEAIGYAIVTLGKEGEWDDTCLGILDTYGDPSRKGTWLLKPWQAYS